MSILNEEDNLIDEASKNKEVFRVPKVCFDDENEISLQKSMLISLILHPVVVGTVWLLTFILMLLGLVNPLAKRPELKMKDIEFVLVEKEAPPINKNTPYRADKDSRAGGKHDPTKKVSLPSAPGNKMQKSQQPSKPAKAQKPQAPQKASAPQPAQKPQQTAAAQPAPKPTKQPPSAKPSVRPPMTPKVVEKPTSKFTVPVPTGGTQAGKYSTGPVSGSGKVASRAVNSARATAPSPTLAPTGGSSASGSKLANSGGGYGSAGNPGPGNPNGAPGIDAIREPDFGPYMRELQRRIKMNWDPPKGDQSKRVVLMFKIAKDGRLLSCSVHKSSGLPNADKAAIQAVQLTAPFKPLPPDFKGSNIDIQFTFDYNVFGASGYN